MATIIVAVGIDWCGQSSGPSREMDKLIIFSCPKTGFDVQTYFARKQEAGDKERHYEAPAAHRVLDCTHRSIAKPVPKRGPHEMDSGRWAFMSPKVGAQAPPL
jgi:hypothetical protein